MIRVATNSCEQYLALDKRLQDPSLYKELISDLQYIDNLIQDSKITVISIGPFYSPQYIQCIPNILDQTKNIFTSYLGKTDNFSIENTKSLAECFLQIADLKGGMGSLRFTVSSNLIGGCPYFPGSYHYSGFNLQNEDTEFNNGQKYKNMFSIGLENSESLAVAFQDAKGSLKKFQSIYSQKQLEIAQIIQDIALKISQATSDLYYNGIDLSIAPGMTTQSIIECYKNFGVQHLNQPGALTVTSAITQVLKEYEKNQSIRTCGYCGVMLAICEDHGLAKETEHGLTVNDLLLLSSVCGVGLDCIPITGNKKRGTENECNKSIIEQMAFFLMDMHTMAQRLNKPLSCRFLPAPQTSIGDMTDFQCPLLVNARTMSLSRST